MGFRITTLIFGFAFLYSALVFNVYNLQIRKGDYYSAKAASVFDSALQSERGGIYFTDKSGNRISVAINREYPTIYADNRAILDRQETVNTLAGIVDVPEAKLNEIFSKSNDPYESILRKASKADVESVKNAAIPGVGVDYESLRFYPFGSVAAHMLGFVSLDDSNSDGVYGAELYYNESLKGAPGRIEGDKLIPSRPGADLALTIDRNIQSQAEDVMARIAKDYQAEGGTILIQNPKTGAILAMVSYPSFDPNDYGTYNIKNFLNPVLQSVYEPGSVMKVITMAAGIDSGKITPDTVFNDTGSLILNGKTIRNWDLKAHGRMTMTNVIEKSVNTGAAFAEKTMGHETFREYLGAFGFGERTGIDLPGEVRGSLATLGKNARDVNFATASFGQGISMTPIQLISAISAIGNGGMMMTPYINSELAPKQAGRVISADTARKVAGMMVSAVDKAEAARISGYTVAGKTGTAQVPDFKHGGYGDEFIHTYVGFVPAYDPQFTVLVKLDRPKGSQLAGLTIVPAFRELAQFMLNYYNVPPDNVKSNRE